MRFPNIVPQGLAKYPSAKSIWGDGEGVLPSLSRLSKMVREERDQDDEWNRYAQQIQQNRTHETSLYSEDLNGLHVIALSPADGRSVARAKRPG